MKKTSKATEPTERTERRRLGRQIRTKERRAVERARQEELWTGPPLKPAELLQQFTELAAEQLDRYEGTDLTLDVVKSILRTAVLDSLRARELHVNQLAEIDRFACNTTKLSSLQRAIGTQMQLARLERVMDVSDPSLFTVVEGEGEVLELVQPAYVDRTDSRLVLTGQARRVSREQADEEATTLGISE